MLLEITVFGLCVIKQSSSNATPHIIYPVAHFDHSGNNDHGFILQAPKKTVDWNEIPSDWWTAAGRMWTCTLPDNATVSIEQPDKGKLPGGASVDPITLSDLNLKLISPPPPGKTLGEFTLPRPKSDLADFKWIEPLGNYKLKCTGGIVREIADLFVWQGVFENKDVVKVTITYVDDQNQTRTVNLKLKEDKNDGWLDIVCENPEAKGDPFDYWETLKNISNTLNPRRPTDCKPVIQKLFSKGRNMPRPRHYNSPSCPPVKS